VRQRNSRSPGLISDIDASAFRGILVVLLFLLMMLTQTPHHGVSADLPKVWHPISMPGANREDALIVSILRDGTMYFGKRPGPATCLHKFEKCGPRGAEKKIYIRADERLRYVSVREVLAAVRSAGVEKIAFLVYQCRAVSSGL
jgi:biopolymer transport protein ExbD